jgi:hypothetical protein
MTEPGTSQQQKAPRLNHAQATKLREYCDKGYELKNKKDLQDVVSEVGCTEHQAKSAWGRLRRAANQNKAQSAVEAGAATGGVLRRPASLSKSDWLTVGAFFILRVAELQPGDRSPTSAQALTDEAIEVGNPRTAAINVDLHSIVCEYVVCAHRLQILYLLDKHPHADC